jgi:hypothetical protein
MTTPDSLRRIQNGEVFTYQRPPAAVAATPAPQEAVVAGTAASVSGGARTAVAVAVTPDVAMDELVQWLVEHPWASHAQIGAAFGKNAAWFASVLVTERFLQALEPHREEVQNPHVTSSMEQRFQALLIRSMDVVQTKMSVGGGDALLAAKIFTKALGYGGLGYKVPPPKEEEKVVTLEDLASRLTGMVAVRNAGEVSDVVPKESPDGPEEGEVSPGAI